MFPNKEWTLTLLNTLLRKINATGDVERRSSISRPHTTCVPDVIDDVQDMILKPETQSSRWLVEQVFHCRPSTELFTKICI